MTLAMLVIVISAVHLVIGVLVGLWLRGRDASPTPEPAAPSVTAPATTPPTTEPTPPESVVEATDNEAKESRVEEEMETVNNILYGLQEFTQSITDQVGRHSHRVDEISQQLVYPEEGATDEAIIRSVVSQLAEANEQLKADLAAAQERLKQQEKEIASRTYEARTDQLTGLANRRAFDEQLARRVDEWWRRDTPLSLMLIDVDHFKQFNDTHGHKAGDRVLSGVAQVLRDTMREMDLVARYGGEEFAVILPSTNASEAERAVLRVLSAVTASVFRYDNLDLKVTVSIGLAEAMQGDDLESLVRRADEALYDSKEAGRNCGHLHVGEGSTRITGDKPVNPSGPQGERRGFERRPFRLKQQIARYDGGELPPKEAYQTVQCMDISTGGFSYLAPVPPDAQSLVVALGVAPSLTYMSSSVAYCTKVETPSGPMYRVGCRFNNRLQAANEGTAPAELKLANIAQ